MLLPSALISFGPDRMGNFGAEHLDFAAVGLPQQGGDLLGKVGAVVHHRQQDAVNLEFGVDLPLHLIYCLEQLFQALWRADTPPGRGL